MKSAKAVNRLNVSGFMTWGSLISGLCVLVGSFLVTMQSPNMHPPFTFDVIQTRVDAFVR